MKKSLFLILLFAVQCNSDIKNRFWFIQENKENKERILNTFNNYIDHFPSEYEYADINYSWILNPKTENNLTLYARGLSKSVIDDYLKKNKNRIIASYLANEDCLLILDRFANRENNGIYELDSTSTENRDCYKLKYPIPNFWQSDYYTEETECHLPKDFTIYVFEAKQGRFIDKNELMAKTSLPSVWNNGFSQGIAISYEKEVIIFWSIIW